jgi:hypothetical protein
VNFTDELPVLMTRMYMEPPPVASKVQPSS